MRRTIAIASMLLGGCALEASCPPADLAAPPQAPAFAIVSSDYGSSAIGLLDAEGALVSEAFFDSGTRPPGIVASLSGDASLPATPLAPCVLTVIDRYNTDVLSFFDVCAGTLIGQLDVGASFRANPQDVLPLEDGRALVSRFTPNLVPDTTPLERGNDVLVIDWTTQTILSRISLDTLNSGEAYARPGRMVWLTRGAVSRVVVGLARLSAADFRAAPGALAVLDGERVEAFELGDLESCDDVDAVPSDPARALIRCSGAPQRRDESRRAGIGLLLVELGEDGALEEVARWSAATHPDAPMWDVSVAPLGGTRVIVAASGSIGGAPDRVAILDLADGTTTPLFDAEGAFVIHEGVFDPVSRRALVPDAARAEVRRFAIEDDGAAELAPTESAPCRGLPPREVRAL